MSHPYDGADPISPNPPIVGKGTWLTIEIPDDDDDRDAASYGIGLEGLADRSNWLAWRMVNGLENGGPYPANITWSGNHTFNGTVTLGTVAGTVTASGAWTFSNVVGFTNVTTFTNKLVHSGNSGYRALRKSTATDAATATIDSWKMDVLEVPELSQDTVYTLAAPPSNEVIELTVYWPKQTIARRLELKDGSRTLCVIHGKTGNGTARDGSVAKIRLEYMGSGTDYGWRVVAMDRAPNVLSGPNGNTTIDAWEYDWIIVPDITASRNWELNTPPTDLAGEVVIHWPDQTSSYALALKIAGGGSNYISVTAGSDTTSGIATITMGYRAGAYFLKSVSGPY